MTMLPMGRRFPFPNWRTGQTPEEGGGYPMAYGSGVIEIPDSYNPNYQLPPERPTEPVPVQGSGAASVSMPKAEVPPTKKKRGLLGSIGNLLENVFMPEPDSLYAAALRGGIWDAKANQRAYRQQMELDDIKRQEANAKLRNLLTKGEYQIAGNNIVHFPPDGGQPVVLTPPATPGEKERLIDAWRKEEDPQVKSLMERMLLGANSDPVLQSREQTARIRAGATTDAARIRASSSGKGGAPARSGVRLPAGAVVLKKGPR